MKKRLKIGFIGQGYVGKNMANDFSRRGYSVVRYSKEKAYIKNKSQIRECDVVFIAVPTPTTKAGFSDKIIREVIPFVGKGKIIVIKSTVLPGLTKKIQRDFRNYIILHSPEFLSEATAARDAAHPFMNVIGLPENSLKHKKAGALVQSILPKAPFSKIVSSEEAELIKYIHNCNAYSQIVFFNLMYDLGKKLGADWSNMEALVGADPTIPDRYSKPVHKGGRGAGGNCFIKDFSALQKIYEKVTGDKLGASVLKSIENKNIELLKRSKKDLKIVKDVYGK